MKWSDELATGRRRLYVDVAEALLRGIEAGTWLTGNRLPSDRELAEQLHVSRPTVREALLVLEFAGVIEIRHGTGAFVIGHAATHVQGTLGSESPAQLVEARLLVEPVIAGLCAVRLSAERIDDLTSLFELSERAVDSMKDPSELIRLGLQFHRALAVGCGNEYLSAFCGALVSVQDHPLWNLLHRQVLTTEDARRRELAGHRDIIDGIRDRDSERAQRAMRVHLEALWSIVLREDAFRSWPIPVRQAG